MIGFELIDTFEAERLMQLHGIVKSFDVREHAQSRRSENFELLARCQETISEREQTIENLAGG